MAIILGLILLTEGSIGVGLLLIDVTDDIGIEFTGLGPLSMERLNCISSLFAFNIRWFIIKLF